MTFVEGFSLDSLEDRNSLWSCVVNMLLCTSEVGSSFVNHATYGSLSSIFCSETAKLLRKNEYRLLSRRYGADWQRRWIEGWRSPMLSCTQILYMWLYLSVTEGKCWSFLLFSRNDQSLFIVVIMMCRNRFWSYDSSSSIGRWQKSEATESVISTLEFGNWGPSIHNDIDKNLGYDI